MTQTISHTPGPWYYNRDEGGTSGYTVNAPMLHREDEYEDVAEIIVPEDMHLTQEEAEAIADANARLITAAPELLSALEKAVTALNNTPSFDTGIYDPARRRNLSSYQLLPELSRIIRQVRRS